MLEKFINEPANFSVIVATINQPSVFIIRHPFYFMLFSLSSSLAVS